MRVLITGASGLVGSRIAQHLSCKGLNLRLATRSQITYRLKNSTICKVNWNSQVSLDAACKDIDVVVHACGMNSQDSLANPISALLVNGVGTARLRLAASREGVRRIIYFSTAHVYRCPLVGKITEECCTLNRHPYASSHLAGESALYSRTILNGPEIIVLRMSNAFGAPLDVRANCWKLLANDLCMQAISTGTLRLGTSGIQSRNFIPLWHVCSVTEKLIRLEFPQASYQVFNLGGTSMSVKDFARLVQAKASTLLGEFVPLEIAEDTAPQQKQGLDYCCRKLTEYLGLSVPEMESEISGLLVFCVDKYKDN